MMRNFLRKAPAWIAATMLAVADMGITTKARIAHGYPDIPVTSFLNDSGDATLSTNYRVESDTVSSSYFNGVNSVSWTVFW